MAYLGIDIGGTKIAIGLIDANGRVLSQRRIATNIASGFDDAMGRLPETEELRATTTDRLAGIGIGSPGPFDRDGTIRDVPTLATWQGRSPLKTLSGWLDVPVVMENDADAALLGEVWMGAAKGCSYAAMLTFGTGVGGATMLEGHLVRGAGGEHPELGHIPLDPGGPLCNCGLRGCLEIIASGTALNAAAAQAGFGDSRKLFAAAAAGEPQAREVVERAVRIVGLASAMLVHSALPEIIVFGGGVMDEHFTMFRPAIAETLARLTPFAHRPTRIARAQLGNGAGVIGAAYAAMRHSLR